MTLLLNIRSFLIDKTYKFIHYTNIQEKTIIFIMIVILF